MATPNWLARALARSQVVTLTPGGTIEVGDLFNVTINGKTLSYAATGTTVASVCTGLAAALTASEIAEFAAITWADATTTVTGTGVAGVPFTVTVATTESNGAVADAQTFVLATTITATGPNHWSDVNNWDTGAIPVNGDTVNVNLELGSILYGLDQSAVTVAALYISGNTQNTVGLPKVNAGGWTEYLEDYLKIGATICRSDTTSNRVKLNFGSVEANFEGRRTGGSPDGTTPPLLIRGTSANNVFDFVTGTAGVAYYDNETAAGATLTIGQAAQVTTGAGANFANTESSGTVLSNGTGTNWKTAAGLAEIRGTPSFSLLDCNGGTTYGNFSGLVNDVVVGPGILDCSNDNSSRTFEDTMLMEGGQIIDPNQTINYTNGITLGDDVQKVAA